MAIKFAGIEGIELTEDQIKALEAKFGTYESPDDVAGLKASRDALLKEKKAADDAAAAAQAAAEQAKLDAAAKNGDVAALKASFEAKIKEQQDIIDAGKALTAKSAIDGAVAALANKLADGTNAELLKPFIEKRLRFDDGVKVTDGNGGLTVHTLDDLEAQFRADKMFENLIVASRASGGGANGSHNNGGAGGVKQDFHGTVAEKTAAVVGKVPALASLPVR